jgi:hypothetical protein
VRAQPVTDGIVYGIVDEYEDMSPDYNCKPARSKLPLTFGQLVCLIDGALPDGGAALSHLYANLEQRGNYPWELRNFVRVSSEFYQQLAEYYERRIAGYFEERFGSESAQDDEAGCEGSEP